MAYTIRAAVVGDIDTLVAFTVRAAYEAEHLATDEAAVRRGVEGAFRNPPLATYWVVETSDNRLVELMLDHLATAAETSGALDLRLYAHRSNERALRAYRRCGFAVAPYVIMTRSRRQERQAKRSNGRTSA